MKNKKYFIFISLISIPYIYSCTTQNSNIPPVNATITPSINIASTPTQQITLVPTSIPNSNLPINNENRIKEVAGKTLNKDFENIFQYNSDRFSISVNNNLLYITLGGSLAEFTLDNIYDKPEKYYCGADWDSGKVNYDGKYDINNSLINSKINTLQEHCLYNISLITGKNNKTYIYSSAKLSEIGSNFIKDVFKFNDNSLSSSRIKLIVDKDSNMYITTDTSIKKLTPIGGEIWNRNLLSNNNEKYLYITSIDVDNSQNLYFFDAKNLLIKVMDKDGSIKTIVGGGNNSGLNINGIDYKLNGSEQVITDNIGNLYILETDKNRILKYDKQTSKIILFSGNNIPSIDNDNKSASDIYLNRPIALTFDSNNNSYIIDSLNKVIRKVDSKTNISSIILGNSISHGD